jgi:hypothetical protein
LLCHAVFHGHRRVGGLYRRVGRRDEASLQVTVIAEMYRAMEMTFWLLKAEAALAGARPL